MHLPRPGDSFHPPTSVFHMSYQDETAYLQDVASGERTEMVDDEALVLDPAGEIE